MLDWTRRAVLPPPDPSRPPVLAQLVARAEDGYTIRATLYDAQPGAPSLLDVAAERPGPTDAMRFPQLLELQSAVDCALPAGTAVMLGFMAQPDGASYEVDADRGHVTLTVTGRVERAQAAPLGLVQ